MKKTKHQHQRSISISLNPVNFQVFDGLALDFDQQQLFGVKNGMLYPLVGQSKLQFKRKRQNGGDKILHESISADGKVHLNSNDPLLTYNHVIAVDTNTRTIQGSKVSVTAAIHLVPTGEQDGFMSASTTLLSVFEAWNVIEKPENHGWWQVLGAVSKQADFYPGKIALVVDSDLGEHELFNSREKPIFIDYYLPENVTIVYGSDKGGPEHLTTNLIKYCHDTADTVFKRQNVLIDTEGLVPGDGCLFSHFRQWNDLDSFKKFVD